MRLLEGDATYIHRLTPEWGDRQLGTARTYSTVLYVSYSIRARAHVRLLVLSGLVHKEVREGEGAKGDRTERAVNAA
jgi:hypothetical protein